jgi:threonine/homoserine/homoserine lactone efflux protein
MGIEFVLTSLLLAVTPGTGVLCTVTAGLGRGARTGLVAARAARSASSRT